MKNIKSRYYLIALIILIAGILFIFNIQNTYLSNNPKVGVTNHDTDRINTTWNGFNTYIETPYLGSVVDGPRRDICGTNDGDLQISNSYDVSNRLSLTTSFNNIQERPCSAYNYIYSEINVSKKGKIIIDYSLMANEIKSNDAEAYIIINSYLEKQILQHYSLNNNPITFSSKKEINISSPTIISIELGSAIGYRGRSSAQAFVSFEEFAPECINGDIKCEAKNFFKCENEVFVNYGEVRGRCGVGDIGTNDTICIPDNSCQSNTCIGNTCLNNCNEILAGKKTCLPNKITVFRFINNNCIELQLYEEDLTENDYLSASDCQQNIMEIPGSEKESSFNYLPWIIGIAVFIFILLILIILRR